MNTQEQAYINGFVKRASEYGLNETQSIELLKQAKRIGISDVENALGLYLRGKDETADAEKGIDEAYSNSFSLRHPYLTGIPTLGIAPTVARENALEKIKHDLFRAHPELHKQHMDIDELKHRRAVELMPQSIQEEKSRSHRNLMNTGAMTALLLADKLRERQEPKGNI